VVSSLIAPTLPRYPPPIAEQTLTKLGNPDARADRRLETFETADTTLEVVLHCRSDVGHEAAQCIAESADEATRLLFGPTPVRFPFEGKVVTWMIEGASPNNLYRLGLTKESLPAGTEITAEGYQAKDGSTRAVGRNITTSEPTQWKNLFDHGWKTVSERKARAPISKPFDVA